MANVYNHRHIIKPLLLVLRHYVGMELIVLVAVEEEPVLIMAV
jgi:hypothetical protein